MFIGRTLYRDFDANGKSQLKYGSALGTIIFAVFVATPALAEQGQMEEIVVTAQKRQENLQTVPISVTAITGEALSNRNVDSLANIDRISPNLLIVPGRTSSAVAGITLRGQAQDDPSSITLDQSVGLYVDGVYVARGNGAFQRLFDIKRVEVLKGPQGTLYGRNTTGGAINVIPNHPTDQTELNIRLGVGNYGERAAAAAVNIPLGTIAAVRAVFDYAKRDGYATNTFGNVNTPLDDGNSFSGRILLDVSPTDKLKISLGYDYYTDKNSGGPVVPVASRSNTRFGPVIAPFLPSNIRVLNQNDRNGIDVRVQGVSATATLDLDSVTVKNIFAWRETREITNSDFDGSQLNLVSGDFSFNQHQYSNELNVSGKIGDRIRWIVGGYYFDEEGRNITKIGLGVLPGFNKIYQLDDGTGRNKSKAIFAEITAQLNDSLSVTGGLRQTWDTKKFISFNIGTNGQPLFPGGSAAFSKDFAALTGSLSINYKLKPDIFLYVKYGRGYRSGGFNIRGIGPLDAPFNPETVDEFEIGAKTEFANGRLRLNAALFYDKYNNIQRVIQGVVNGVPTTTTRNAAKANIYGGELELSALPADGLELSLNIGASIARYSEFIDVIDRSNNRFPLVPDWTANAMVRYTIAETDFATPVVQFDVAWKDSYYLEVYNTETLYQPNYAVANGKISFTKLTGKDMTLSLFGKNIFNRKYILNGRGFGSPFGFDVARFGPPATYGVQFEAHF